MIALLIDWSIKNRVLVILLSLMLTGVGLFSVQRTPVDAIPDLSDVQVIIKTSYPGQAPQVVQDQVTYPLSTAMLSVPGAVNVRGYSFFGDSYVYVIFNDDIDPYWARSRVLEYLNQVAPNLPATAKAQLGPDATGVGWVYMYALVDRTGAHDLAQLRSLQDWFFKFELKSLPGVSEVATAGGMAKQYQIVVDPLKLRAYNMPLSHIESAINRANGEVGASVIEMAEAEYMVRAHGYLTGREDIENISLGMSIDGTPLLLKDIASVNIGPAMRRGVVELNGEGEAVGGIIVMRTGENAKRTIDAVKQKLESLKNSLPQGVEVIPVYDRSALIDSAVQNLWQKLLEEFLVVALVCVVFLLHFRSSLVAIISLPIGILAAFVVMKLQGINANIMSLGGIAIAIGAMIDGAIVMIENMHKHIEQTPLNDQNRWQVVALSAKEVGPALFFSLLIITVSFLPVFTLEAQEGRMFSPLAYTKTYAMAAAAILAVTLVPVLMGYLVRGKILPERKNPINRLLIAAYKPLLRGALHYPKTIIIAALLILSSALWPLQKIGYEFMPPLDEGDLMYMPTTYAGISVGKARELLQQTDKLIKSVPEVESVFGKVGRAETATDPAPLTMIETFIQFKPRDQWRAGMTLQALKDELDSRVKLPGVSNAWVMPIKTRIDMLATGIKTPIGIKIAGPDLTVIQTLGEQLEQVLAPLAGTTSVYSERVAGGRYITLDINRVNAARFGLNIADIQQVITTAVGGRVITETVEGLERYGVNLRYPQDYRDSPEALAALPVITANGQHITLSDVADIRIKSGAAMIKSENARLNGWTLVDIQDIDIATYIDNAREAIAAEINLPAGYSVTFAGQYEYMARAKAKLSYVVPLTISLIILLLYLSFRRVGDVALILTTLPLALVGSLWLMYWLAFNFSMASIVGLIALCGVAVEIGVIMLVYLNQALGRIQQTEPLTSEQLKAAVMEGAVLRVRPVLMTTVATIAGLLPIMWGQGTGSEVMQRLAAPMVGGMISALVLTLIVMPCCFYLRYQIKAKSSALIG